MNLPFNAFQINPFQCSKQALWSLNLGRKRCACTCVRIYFWSVGQHQRWEKTFLRRSVTTGVQNNINASPWRMSVRRGKEWTRSRPQVHPVVTGHQARPRAQPVTERQSVRGSFTSQNKWERSGRFVLLIAFHSLSRSAYNDRAVDLNQMHGLSKLQRSWYGGVGAANFLQPHERQTPGMWFSWVFLGFLGYEIGLLYDSEVKFIHSNWEIRVLALSQVYSCSP